MPTRDSVLYTKLHTNKYVGDARDRAGRVVQIPFEHTVIPGELSADLVNLCELPANCEVIAMRSIASVTFGTATLAIGDVGDPDRYQVAIAMIAEAKGDLASTGMRYRPTANTIVQLLYGAATPGAGGTLKGAFLITPGA